MPTGPAAGMLKLLTRSKSTRRSDNHLPVVITNKRYSAVEPSTKMPPPAAAAPLAVVVATPASAEQPTVVVSSPQQQPPIAAPLLNSTTTAALRKPSAKLREGVRHRTHTSRKNHQVSEKLNGDISL
ncbi:uncharacterized protein [Rhodnius prolixus]|uniref:uncharacterized protein n=1 Tax=Rhodnius prolixus TaxID=13249 RepID=UPI003D18E037